MKSKLENNHIYVLILVALILVHGLFDTYFKIDNVTILLVLIILLLPYLSLIRKVKYGDFEAEITKEDVNALKEKVEEVAVGDQAPSNEQQENELKALAESDLQLALAKVRIEIEKKIKNIYQIYFPSFSEYLHYRTSVNAMIRELNKKGIVDSQLCNALTDLVSVANRAIHGEDISTENKKVLVNSAIDLLSKLDSFVIDHALLTMKKEITDSETVDQYANAIYKVNTIVPYVNKPEIRSYVLNQSELYAFLDDYGETAEFVIEIKKIKPSKEDIV